MKKLFSILITGLIFLSVSYAQEMDPEAAKAYNSGNELLRSGDYEGAITKYKEALNTTKDYRAFYQLGIAYKKSNKLQEAKETFLAGIEQKPDFEAFYNALGGTEFALGDYTEAIDHYKILIEKTKNQKYKNAANEYIARCYVKIGTEELTNGNYDAAINNFSEAVNHHNYDAAYLFLAQSYVETAQYEKALEAADNAINYRESISKGAPYYYKGLAFKNMGDKQKALENFRSGLEDSKYKKLCQYEIDSM